MKYCKECEIAREGKFCWVCGSELEEKVILCACKYELHPSDKFCPNCGRPVHEIVKEATGEGGGENGEKTHTD